MAYLQKILTNKNTQAQNVEQRQYEHKDGALVKVPLQSLAVLKGIGNDVPVAESYTFHHPSGPRAEAKECYPARNLLPRPLQGLPF